MPVANHKYKIPLDEVHDAVNDERTGPGDTVFVPRNEIHGFWNNMRRR